MTSVDIQSVEPVDQKTKDSLMKSVQLAIEITTNAQEAIAKHEAQRIEQEAKVSFFSLFFRTSQLTDIVILLLSPISG